MLSFPQIGTKPVSDFIYALISAWIRLHELLYGLVDFLVVAVVGDRCSEPEP